MGHEELCTGSRRGTGGGNARATREEEFDEDQRRSDLLVVELSSLDAAERSKIAARRLEQGGPWL